MIYPLVRELAAEGIPVAVTCRVLKIARQPYYRWLAAPVTEAEWTAAARANAIFDAHRDDPEFGYRFLADEARDAGQVMTQRTAWRICSDNGWWSTFGKRRRGKKARAGAPAHEDLVRREFTAPGPNQVWLSDLTEHPTREGKLYLCAIKDVWSRRIVGYSIADRMESAIAVAALDSAVARRAATGMSVAGCVLHTDRGSQFRARKLQRFEQAAGASVDRTEDVLAGVVGAGATPLRPRRVPLPPTAAEPPGAVRRARNRRVPPADR
jgi:hypothetical protein